MENQTKIQYQVLDQQGRIDYIKLCKQRNIKVECKLIEGEDGKKVIGYKVLEKEEEKKILDKPTITFVIDPISVKEETKLNFIIPEIANDEIITNFNGFQYCENCQTERSHTLFRNIVRCNDCQKSYTIGL